MTTLQCLESVASLEILHAHEAGGLLRPALVPQLATNAVDFTLAVAA